MPHYTVAIFGVQGPQAILDATQAIGVTLRDMDKKDGTGKGAVLTTVEDICEALENCSLDLDVPDTLTARLDAAFVAAIAMLAGTTHQGTFTEYRRTCHKVDTPFGPRVSTGFAFEIAHDNGECGDELDDAIFGIPLSSRYKPVLLDLHSAHGGIGRLKTTDLMHTEMILRAAFPALANADTFIKECFA